MNKLNCSCPEAKSMFKQWFSLLDPLLSFGLLCDEPFETELGHFVLVLLVHQGLLEIVAVRFKV